MSSSLLPPLLLNPSSNKEDGSPAVLKAVRGPTDTTNWVIGGLAMHGPLPVAPPPPLPSASIATAAAAAEAVSAPPFASSSSSLSPPPSSSQQQQQPYSDYLALVPLRFTLFVSLVEDVDAPTRHYLEQYRRDTSNGRVRALSSLSLADGAPLERDRHFEPFMQMVRAVADHILYRDDYDDADADDDDGCAADHRRRVYIHCWKGHGRSGMFVAALLSVLYGLVPMRALSVTDRLHSCRVDDKGMGSPENHEQRMSVMQLLAAEGKEKVC